MRLALFTGDTVFRTAVTGLAGALGHSMAGDGGSDAVVTICDAGTVDFIALAEELNPLRTIVFVPSNPVLTPPQAVLGAFLHVAPRTDLAADLPRLISLLSD